MKRYSFYAVAAVLLMALVWVGCSTEQAPVVGPSGPEGLIAATKPASLPPGLDVAMAAQDKHTDRLMAIAGVVGTATGLGSDGQPVVKVYMTAPGVPGIPSSLDGVPVVAEVTGMFVARSDPRARFPRPVPIGVSTGHPDITAGTIGCRVKDAFGNVYALSNNHVYANTNKANIGDSALQPGPYDGGTDPADKIGELADFESIQMNGPPNLIDAAIAASSSGQVGYATPSDDGYGAPGVSTVNAWVGLAVQKYGRTTRWTHGSVNATNATVDVCYKMAGPYNCKQWARFVDQIVVTPGTFSGGGDSGSLIVTDDGNRNPVGLLFAGSDAYTIANPIDAVLNRFGVTIDDGSGQGNIPPSASFSYAATDLTVAFTDQSTDPDGSIEAWAWTFGDGGTSAEQNPSHTYATGDTYTVTLTVTDDGGATGSASQDVTVTTGGGGISLSATGYKVKGRQKADLEWTGATSADVDVYRDGAKIATTGNDGFYTDNINNVGGGSYTYQVHDAGTDTWSNEAVVTF